MTAQPAPRILVARLSSLGDIMLTAPVYRNLKNKWPGCHVALLVKPQFAPALAGHPCIDEIIPFYGIFKTAKRIRAGRFTHFLDLHANLRTFLLGFLCRIPNKTRYKKDALLRRLFVGLKIPSPALQKHTLERYLAGLAAWDVPAAYASPELADWRGGKTATPPQFRNICVYQTAFLGDAVLTLPLIEKAAQLFPGTAVSVVSRPDTMEIFRASPHVNEVIADDKKQSGWLGFFKIAKALKSRRFDLVLVPHRSFRSALAVFLSGIPQRVGFDTSAGAFLFTKTVPFSWLLHDAERNMSLLTAVSGPEITTAQPLMAQSAGAAFGAKAKLKAAGIRDGEPLAGIHPGSVWFTKRWPAERYAETVKRLRAELGLRSVIIGGPQDAALGDYVCKLAAADAVNLAGKTSLAELMAVMPVFKVFITNDSGPMHIATAFKVPVVAIFGPTTKELGFFPCGEGNKVLEKPLDCRPCALHGGKKCPRGHFLCMRLITAKDVVAAAKEITSPSASRSA